MSEVFWWVAGAVVFVFVIILRRVWPYLHGRARKGDTKAQTFNRWNTYMVPMMRKYITEDLLVGLAGSFLSRKDAVDYTSATWSLQPTLFPDVDFIALAGQGDSDEESFAVLGFIEASRLRELIGNTAEPQVIFGHRTWVYVWPEGIDYATIIESCVPADEFMELHGLKAVDRTEAS